MQFFLRWEIFNFMWEGNLLEKLKILLRWVYSVQKRNISKKIFLLVVFYSIQSFRQKIIKFVIFSKLISSSTTKSVSMHPQQLTLLTHSSILFLTRTASIFMMNYLECTTNNLLKLWKSLDTSSNRHHCSIYKLRYLKMDICRRKISWTCFHFQ